jgi:hypothetical protein
MRPGVINYQVGSALHENVFVTIGNNLHLKYYDGTLWHTPVNLGNPGVGLPNGAPAPINLGTNENVFVTDAANNLDYAWTSNGTTWNWANNLGNPGLAIESNPTVANYQVGTAVHENVFVVDAHGNLDLKAWDGSKWLTWVNLGSPGSQLSQFADPVVINYGTYENVFATDITGNVDYAWTANGTTWHWVNLGNPGVGVYSTPAAINFLWPYEDVFVRDGNGNLDNVYWNGTSWNWSYLGNAGLPLQGDPAVINYQAGSVLHQNAFVQDVSNNMNLAYWDGAAWHWTNLGNPGGGIGLGDPSVINYQVGSIVHENVFMFNGDLRLLYWNGGAWQWTDFGAVTPNTPVIQASPTRTVLSGAAAEAGALRPSPSQASTARDLFFAAPASQQDLWEPLGLLNTGGADLLI